jgi:hypothetical protein
MELIGCATIAEMLQMHLSGVITNELVDEYVSKHGRVRRDIDMTFDEFIKFVESQSRTGYRLATVGSYLPPDYASRLRLQIMKEVQPMRTITVKLNGDCYYYTKV